MQEKILQRRLTSYWELGRRTQPVPAAERINPEALSDIISHCCVWRVEIGNENAKVPFYTFEYIGDELKKVVGKDISGEIVSPRMRKMPVPSARIIEKIEAAIDSKAIVEESWKIRELERSGRGI